MIERDISNDPVWMLRERIKELTALHKVSAILNDVESDIEKIMEEVVKLLPFAWQYPEITQALICFDKTEVKTENYCSSEWFQEESFYTQTGQCGLIRIVYLEKKPDFHEGPFLVEERDLIKSLAQMLTSFFERRGLIESLEQMVSDRTNALQKEVSEHRHTAEIVEKNQEQLRRMSIELSMTEEREKRLIASNLHDHIGQALAMLKQKLIMIRGESVFSGLEKPIDDSMRLLEQIILYTRNLTFEISHPILYELGLFPAIQWLAEQKEKKYIRCTAVQNGCELDLSEEQKIVIFTSVRELLNNIDKHAEAKEAFVILNWNENGVIIEISDNGKGFDCHNFERIALSGKCFGLFSIRERLRGLGGNMLIQSAPGQGTLIRLDILVKLR